MNGNILCLNEKFLVVVDNEGAIILLLYTFVTYSYAVVMLYVFYLVPKSSGLAVDLSLDVAEIKIEPLDSRQQKKSIIDSEQNAREVFRAMANDDQFSQR